MDYAKNSLACCLLLISLFSCRSSKTHKFENGVIIISSVLAEDVCSLSINDSLYFSNRAIITDRSLGADPKNWVKLESVKIPFEIHVACKSNLLGEEKQLRPVFREIELDTILDLTYGKYLWIEVRNKNINIAYSKRPIKLD